MENYTVVGIDFGTSTTVVKVKKYYDSMDILDYKSFQFNNSNYLPTLIFKDENGQRYFGDNAEKKASNQRTNGKLYKNFKMDLINPGKHEVVALELVKEFFGYIYSEIKEKKNELGISSSERIDICLSHPVKWSEDLIQSIEQCVRDAGFDGNIYHETEPNAAIYALLLANLNKLEYSQIFGNEPINVMMLDMGAGTSDIAIFKFRIDDNNKPLAGEDNQIINYPNSECDSEILFGGKDIDDSLTEYLIQYAKSISKKSNISSRLEKIISDSAKTWKEQIVSPCLFENRPKEIGLPERFIDFYDDDLPSKDEIINRKLFEEWTKFHWKKLHSLIIGAVEMAENNIKDFKGAEDIDLVILTGGHSKWYVVKELIQGKKVVGLEPINFSKIIAQPKERILYGTLPQETVAVGLVYKDLPFGLKAPLQTTDSITTYVMWPSVADFGAKYNLKYEDDSVIEEDAGCLYGYKVSVKKDFAIKMLNDYEDDLQNTGFKYKQEWRGSPIYQGNNNFVFSILVSDEKEDKINKIFICVGKEENLGRHLQDLEKSLVEFEKSLEEEQELFRLKWVLHLGKTFITSGYFGSITATGDFIVTNKRIIHKKLGNDLVIDMNDIAHAERGNMLGVQFIIHTKDNKKYRFQSDIAHRDEVKKLVEIINNYKY